MWQTFFDHELSKIAIRCKKDPPLIQRNGERVPVTKCPTMIDRNGLHVITQITQKVPHPKIDILIE